MTLSSSCHVSWERIVIPRQLITLIHAPFTFHLTGSRFFGYETKESDYDFFIGVAPWQNGAPNKSKVTGYLEVYGFQLEAENKYAEYSEDNNIVEIWVYDGDPKVHVQLVTSEAVKHLTHEIITRHFPAWSTLFGTMNKRQRKAVWGLAQEFARSKITRAEMTEIKNPVIPDSPSEAMKHDMALEAALNAAEIAEEDYLPNVDDSDGGE